MVADRVEFANGLRGVAAVLVVVSHYMTAFWLDRPGTLTPLRLESFAGPNPALTGWTLPPVPHVWTGAVGVGLFFLISGFVIPFSLLRYRAPAFLAARLVRILPTYAAGFLIGMAALAASFWWRGVSFPFEPSHVALHAIAGMRALISFDRIDGVVWTLEMELRFYALCAIVAGAIAAGRLVAAYAVPLALFGACLLMYAVWPVSFSPALGKLISVPALSAPFMTFMFVGIAFNLHFRRAISSATLIGVVGLLLALFAASVALTPSPLGREGVVSYVVALGLFSAAYKLPDAWARSSLVRWFAAISYPLYAVHAILGYTLMWHLVHAGLNADAIVVSAWASALPMAWLLHLAVERPSVAAAQRLARGMTTGTSAIVARMRRAWPSRMGDDTLLSLPTSVKPRDGA